MLDNHSIMHGCPVKGAFCTVKRLALDRAIRSMIIIEQALMNYCANESQQIYKSWHKEKPMA